MKIVFLDRKSIGEDIDLTPFNDFGEVIIYDYSTVEEAAVRTADADSAANAGGYQNRLDYIEQLIKQENLTAEVFLFPNNKEDGDFETLLEHLVQKSLHHTFFDCFHDYESCLGTNYVAPNRKAKLFSYVSSQRLLSNSQRKNIGKGEWLFDNPALWNMNAPYLDALKNFLNTWIP